jgi:hypothetical protein
MENLRKKESNRNPGNEKSPLVKQKAGGLKAPPAD